MAVIKLDDPFFPDDPDPRCLLCSDPLKDDEPIVFWAGVSNLYLHGSCAGTFVLRLARDAWEVERDANDGKHSLTVHGPGRKAPTDADTSS
jgi:hypothetical protein